MNKWSVFWLVCVLTFLVFLGSALSQEKYPDRPIQLVVPFDPGGSHDVPARIYAGMLGKALKTEVMVVNRAGASGALGTSYAVRAKKDGYTLLHAGQGPITINPLITDVSYDSLKDLTPIGLFGYGPTVFAVRSDSPFKSLKELVEYARKNPGKVKNAAGGIATASQFNFEIMCDKNNINIDTVPYKSGGEAMVALLGGHVDITSSGVLSMGPQIRAGKLRGLVITMKTRHPFLLDVPTTAEAGYPYMDVVFWVGIFAPTGVPQHVLNVLNPIVEKVFKDPEIEDRAQKAGFILDYKGPEEFREFIASDILTVGKTVEKMGLRKK